MPLRTRRASTLISPASLMLCDDDAVLLSRLPEVTAISDDDLLQLIVMVGLVKRRARIAKPEGMPQALIPRAHAASYHATSSCHELSCHELSCHELSSSLTRRVPTITVMTRA